MNILSLCQVSSTPVSELAPPAEPVSPLPELSGFVRSGVPGLPFPEPSPAPPGPSPEPVSPEPVSAGVPLSGGLVSEPPEPEFEAPEPVFEPEPEAGVLAA